MRPWFRSLLITAVAAAPLAFAAPASAIVPLNATWIVTYYVDPTGAAAGTECVNFHKHADSNGVVTGTWNSPTFPGWTGAWVQKGQHYSWYGQYEASGQTVASYDSGDLINPDIGAEPSAGFFAIGTAKPTPISTGTVTLMQVPSCSGLRVHHGPHPFSGY
jgi:hypothetical protein